MAAAASGGCGDSGPLTTVDFHLIGPPIPLIAGGCPSLPARTPPSLPGAASIRLTYRRSGGGPLVCDAVLPLDGARRAVAVPDAADGAVDFWVEFFGDPPATRLGLGVVRDLDLTAGGAVDVHVLPAGAFACAPALLDTARAFHSATLLPTGEVLLVGGVVADPSGAGDAVVGAAGSRALYASAAVELFDPASGETRPLSAPTLRPRAFHHAALVSTDPIAVALYGGLTVNGDASLAPVAVEGGSADPLRLLPGPEAIAAPTEILGYDPTSFTVTVTPVADATSRGLFSAAAPDGSLDGTPPLIAGGWTDASRTAPLLRADILDRTDLTPAGQTALLGPRIGATITPLGGDSALVWGGHLPAPASPPPQAGELLTGLSTAPASQALTWDGASATPGLRAFHAAALAGDGSVIVAGGFTVTDTAALVPEPVIAQRIRLGATALASDLTVTGGVPAGYLDAVTLAGGDLLICGGNPATGAAGCLPSDPGLGCATGAAYRYLAATATLLDTGAMLRPRYGHHATRLADDTVLVTGGLGPADGMEVIDDAEIYDPRTADPLADLAPAVVRAPGDVARDAADQVVAACPIIDLATDE